MCTAKEALQPLAFVFFLFLDFRGLMVQAEQHVACFRFSIWATVHERMKGLSSSSLSLHRAAKSAE